MFIVIILQWHLLHETTVVDQQKIYRMTCKGRAVLRAVDVPLLQPTDMYYTWVTNNFQHCFVIGTGKAVYILHFCSKHHSVIYILPTFTHLVLQFYWIHNNLDELQQRQWTMDNKQRQVAAKTMEAIMCIYVYLLKTMEVMMCIVFKKTYHLASILEYERDLGGE